MNSPVKVGADLVCTASLESMALRAARLEEGSTLAGVAYIQMKKRMLGSFHSYHEPHRIGSGRSTGNDDARQRIG